MDITNNNVKEEKTNSVPHNVLVPECLAKKADRVFFHSEKKEKEKNESGFL